MRAAQGVSVLTTSADAAREAVHKAQKELGQKPFAAQVFVGADHDGAAVARTLAEELPGVPVIGCSTDGEISAQGLSVDSVCLVLLASDKITARAAFIGDLSRDSLAAGRELAQRLNGPRSRVLFLLPDGLTGNGSAIIRGALDVLGQDFIIAGGTAGDRGRFQRTFQIINGECVHDALVGMMLDMPSEAEVGFGVMSGWRPMGIAKQVSEAVGNTVLRIEGQTALEVYGSFLGDKVSQLPAIGVEYPFALVDESGLVDERGIRAGEEYILLRAPMTVNHATGAIGFAAEIPQGAKIKMTRAKTEEVIAAAAEAAKRAMKRLSGAPDVVFFFSCMARKVVLGRRTDREIKAAQEVFGAGVPMVGFYTYGEIANCGESRPMCRFHNETATFLTIRER
jgi:hypothetical protein